MPDLRKMTVQRLRELARKVLGPGHSRLRTKGELVAALEDAEKKVTAAVQKAGARARAATARVSAATGKAVRSAKAAGKAAKKALGEEKSTRGGTARGKLARAAAAAATGAAMGAAAARRKASRRGAPERAEAEPVAEAEARAAAARAVALDDGADALDDVGEPGLPDPEGYFVARVRGEDAAREAPHAMTETGGARPFRGPEGTNGHPFDEGLGELPWTYDQDQLVALPRDPRTMFFYWDHAAATREGGFAGLDHPRVQLWLFASTGAGWERIRTIDFTLEARGWYVHDLEPGRAYRAEIHAVDRAGQARLLGQGSNAAALPRSGPSPVVDDRFVRIPWDVPLGRRLGPGHVGAPFSEEARRLLARLSEWSRFQERPGGGAESAGGEGGAGGMGGVGDRTASGRPTSPGSGAGPRSGDGSSGGRG